MKQIAILFLSMIGTVSVFAQEPLPFMYVRSSDGIKRVNTFNSPQHQLDEIKSHSTSIDPGFKTSCTLLKFEDFVDYVKQSFAGAVFLRFYLAIPDNSAQKKNRITFLIVPCDANKKNIGKAFKFEQAFDKNHPLKSLATADELRNWISNWDSVIPRNLIDANDPNNHPDSLVKTTPATDTRYVTYCLGDFVALFDVLKKHKVPINGSITCTLGATDDTGINGMFINRTIVQISLLNNLNASLKLEDLTFFTSSKAPSVCPGFNKAPLIGSYDVDNGQLCPFTCPN